MCGIVGFNWADEELIHRMTDSIKHRGPDGEGYFLDDSVSLGHRRLAIIDLSPTGKQPMPNEDETIWMTYNGEIYNYIELREDLRQRGHLFKSRTDAEVIIHAYEEWGEESLRRLNGMFGFCIYDKRKEKLFLARDRYGIKPLYYFSEDERFLFASEIKAILQDESVKRRPNELCIYDYLMHNCYGHTDETFFKNINSVLPGHYLIFDLGSRKLEIDKWYELSNDPLLYIKHSQELEVIRKFQDLFFDSIRLRLRSDVEVGSCLSGGLDSSSIVCALQKFTPEHTRKFRTFSNVFPGTEIDESGYIREVTSITGVQPYFTTAGPLDFLKDVKALIYYQEEPFEGMSIFAQWEVMKLASRNSIKVLLDGQGGDELLAGYIFFFGYYFLQLLFHLNFGTLVTELTNYKKCHSDSNDGLLTPFLLLAPSRLKSFLWRHYLHVGVKKEFIKKYRNSSIVPDLMYRPVSLNEALKYRMKYSLPQLLREEDKNSMAFSIESRLPFLDYRLVDFLFSLPEEYKIRRGMTKYILRQSMKEILPEKVRARTSKWGFPTPVDDWFRKPVLKEFISDIISSNSFKQRGYHDPQQAIVLFQKHISGEHNIGQSLWKMVNLELWFRIFID